MLFPTSPQFKDTNIFEVSKKVPKKAKNSSIGTKFTSEDGSISTVNPGITDPSVTQKTEDILSKHEANQQSINATIESLKERIAKDPKKFGETLEKLQSPDKKPTIGDFKFPIINFILMAILFYYILNTSWESLDFMEKEEDYKLKIVELEEQLAKLKMDQEFQEKKDAEKIDQKSLWKRLLWL